MVLYVYGLMDNIMKMMKMRESQPSYFQNQAI